MAQLTFDAPGGAGEADGFRGPEVCKIAGITYRQLDHWTRTDLVQASIAPARGSGTQRVYSYRDLVEVRVIKQLRDAGVSLQRARPAIEFLREQGGDLASASFVIEGDSVLLARTDGEVVDLLRRGQGVLFVGLAGVVEELDARIHELSPERASATPTGRGEADRGEADSGDSADSASGGT